MDEKLTVRFSGRPV